MKKFEQERLEFWKTKSDVNPNAAAAAVAIKKQNPMMMKKKKKYSISKIDMSASANAKRPKTSSQNFMRRSSNMQYAVPMAQVPKTRVNRSTNNMYEQFQHRPMTSPYHPLHVDMAD